MPSGVGLIFSWNRRLVPIASMRDGLDDRSRPHVSVRADVSMKTADIYCERICCG
jgi:hypothetical protein